MTGEKWSLGGASRMQNKAFPVDRDNNNLYLTIYRLFNFEKQGLFHIK